MRAVVFDFDGVLVDSEPLHFRALKETLRLERIEIDEDEYYSTYLAYDDREAIRVALEQHAVPRDREQIQLMARRKAEIFEALIPEITFFPGAQALVRTLHDELPLGIASGALRGEIEAILETAGLSGAFATIVGADDVAHGKPHPEPYLSAMTRLPGLPGLRPEDCLAIEDSPPGIVSARAAGMKVLAITHSYPRPKLGSADRVVDSLEGLNSAVLRSLFTPIDETD